MNTHALTIAIRLLTAAATGVALGTMTGCPFYNCPEPGWDDPVAIELGVSVDLEAFVLGPEVDVANGKFHLHLVVGAGGTVVGWGFDYDTNEQFVDVFTVGSADLHAGVSTETAWWVVGDGGFVASSEDLGLNWQPVDAAGTLADLYGIAVHQSSHVAVGDDVVVLRQADGTWVEATAPADGWGLLRGVYSDGTRVYAVGLGGVAWSAADPSGEWTAEPLGVNVDLFGVANLPASLDGPREDSVVIFGAEGTLIFGDSARGWTTLDTGVSTDFIASSTTGFLAADGTVYDLRDDDTLIVVDSSPGARALKFASELSVTTVGEGGVAKSVDFYHCVGGRPFVVGDELRTASLGSGDACEVWCAALSDNAPELEPELARTLAAAWAQDGLYEHASVASFARFALELLALGAPPRLIREIKTASADELHHARLCFGLARRFGGAALGPGPMSLGAGALARAGDPVATALALFEEGCINESIAACEAADAAAASRDPAARSVLEIIAADERRHATLAWAGLRWLLDTHGARVAAPLRDRLARLTPARAPDHEIDPRLVAYGRLPPRRRTELRGRVITELVRPLALAMLDADSSGTRVEFEGC